MRNTTTALATLAALATLTAACGGGPTVTTGTAADDSPGVTASATAKPATVGKPLTVSGLSSGLEATYTLTKAAQKDADEFGSAPKSRAGVFLLVHLKVQVHKGQATPSPNELSFVTAAGRVTESDCCTSFNDYPALSYTALRTGQSVDGWVVFDVPREALNGGRVQLTLQQGFDQAVYGYWTLQPRP